MTTLVRKATPTQTSAPINEVQAVPVWAPSPAPAVVERGVFGWLKEGLKAVDGILSGPPMTERERTLHKLEQIQQEEVRGFPPL